jgi:hypothetical protein
LDDARTGALKNGEGQLAWESAHDHQTEWIVANACRETLRSLHERDHASQNEENVSTLLPGPSERSERRGCSRRQSSSEVEPRREHESGVHPGDHAHRVAKALSGHQHGPGPSHSRHRRDDSPIRSKSERSMMG